MLDAAHVPFSPTVPPAAGGGGGNGNDNGNGEGVAAVTPRAAQPAEVRLPFLAGVPPLTVLRQTLYLFVQSLRVRGRQRLFALGEVGFPVLVVVLYCVLFMIVAGHTSAMRGKELYSGFSVPPLGSGSEHLGETYAPTIPAGKLWFAVDRDSGDDAWRRTAYPTLRRVVTDMLTRERFLERGGSIEWHHSPVDMMRLLCKASSTPNETALLPMAAVTFTRLLTVDKKCLAAVRRLTSTKASLETRFNGIHYIIHQSEMPAPGKVFTSVRPYQPSPSRTYGKSGLLGLQRAVDAAILAATTPTASFGTPSAAAAANVNTTVPATHDAGNTSSGHPFDVQFLRYPPESAAVRRRLFHDDASLLDDSNYVRKMIARDQVFRRGGGPALAISWIMLFCVTATSSVKMVQAETQSSLMALGLSPVAHAMASVVATLLVSVVPIFLQIVVLKETEALINIDSSALGVFILCFVFSVIGLANLLAVFFRNPSHTSLFSVVVYCLVVLCGAAIAECETGHDGTDQACVASDQKKAASLLSPVAFILGFRDMLIITNDHGAHVTWESLSTRTVAASAIGDLDVDFGVSTTLGMMVGDAFLYFLLAWYLSRVTRNGYTWYFPLQRSYWFRPPHDGPPKPARQSADHEPQGRGPIKPGPRSGVLAVRGLSASVPVFRPFSIRFRDGQRKVLDGIDIDLHPGEVLSILGSEGKSTFLKCLSGQVIPNEGTFHMDGRRIVPSLYQYQMKVGLCPQGDILVDCLTVYEHLFFIGVIKGIGRLQVKASVESMAAQFDLLSVKDRSVAELTPGQKKKLQVAMAFIGNPRFVLLDEPTLDMDPVSIRQVRDVIRRYKKGRIVCLCTTSMQEAELVSDRIAVLQEGRCRCLGSSSFLKRRFGCGYLLTIGKGRATTAASGLHSMCGSTTTLGGTASPQSTAHLLRSYLRERSAAGGDVTPRSATQARAAGGALNPLQSEFEHGVHSGSLPPAANGGPGGSHAASPVSSTDGRRRRRQRLSSAAGARAAEQRAEAAAQAMPQLALEDAPGGDGRVPHKVLMQTAAGGDDDGVPVDDDAHTEGTSSTPSPRAGLGRDEVRAASHRAGHDHIRPASLFATPTTTAAAAGGFDSCSGAGYDDAERGPGAACAYGGLMQRLRLEAPSAYSRETQGEVRMHIPLLSADELVSVLRELETPGSAIAREVRTWSLRMNGLEDIYLRLLEEDEAQVACPYGHVMTEIDRSLRCDGLAGSPCPSARENKKLYCFVCKLTLCAPCAKSVGEAATKVGGTGSGGGNIGGGGRSTRAHAQYLVARDALRDAPTPQLAPPQPPPLPPSQPQTQQQQEQQQQPLQQPSTRASGKPRSPCMAAQQAGSPCTLTASRAGGAVFTPPLRYLATPHHFRQCSDISFASAFEQQAGQSATPGYDADLSVCVDSTKLEGMPAKFHSFWEDTNFQEYLDNQTRGGGVNATTCNASSRRQSDDVPPAHGTLLAAAIASAATPSPSACGDPATPPLKSVPSPPAEEGLLTCPSTADRDILSIVSERPATASATASATAATAPPPPLAAPLPEVAPEEAAGSSVGTPSSPSFPTLTQTQQGGGGGGAGGDPQAREAADAAARVPAEDRWGRAHGDFSLDKNALGDLLTDPDGSETGLPQPVSHPTPAEAEAGAEVEADATEAAVADTTLPVSPQRPQRQSRGAWRQSNLTSLDLALVSPTLSESPPPPPPSQPYSDAIVAQAEAALRDHERLDEFRHQNMGGHRTRSTAAEDVVSPPAGAEASGGAPSRAGAGRRSLTPEVEFEETSDTDSDLSWVPVDAPRKHRSPAGALPQVVFTAPHPDGQSFVATLQVLVMLKRYNMSRNNPKAVLYHIVLPLCFVFAALVALRYMAAESTVVPTVTLEHALLGPGSGHPQMVEVPVKGNTSFLELADLQAACVAGLLYGAQQLGGDGVSESTPPLFRQRMCPRFLKVPASQQMRFEAIIGDLRVCAYSGAAIEVLPRANAAATPQITVHFNASSAHVLPATLNLMTNAVLWEQLVVWNATMPPYADAASAELAIAMHMLFGNNYTVSTSLHNISAQVPTESALILSFALLASVGMAFISSGFAVPIVVETSSGARLLQQTAGLSTRMYWLGNYVWDSFLSFGITVCVAVLFLVMDPLFQDPQKLLALSTVTYLYLQATLFLTYTASHYFTAAWRAQTGIALTYLLAMLVPFIFSVSITSSGATFLRSFSNLAIFIFNPLYSLIDSWMMLAEYVSSDDASFSPFYIIRQPLYGLLILFVIGFVLLCAFEARTAMRLHIKKWFPRPSGFYNEHDEYDRQALLRDPSEREEVENERREVERVKSSGRIPATGILMHQLRRFYKTTRSGKVTALHSLDLYIPGGEIFALLGPTGAGKTTTTSLVVGGVAPSQGCAYIGGHSILTDIGQIRQNIGVCLQKKTLIDELTVCDHITLYATLKGIPQQSIGALADVLMVTLDLHRYRFSIVGELSQGVTRRLSLLLAFIGRPKVLVLDEPTSGMDLVGRKRAQRFMLSWMKQVRGSARGLGGAAAAAAASVADRQGGAAAHGAARTTALITTHSIDEAQMLSTRMGILVKGKLRRLGKLQALASKYGQGWSLSVRTPDELRAQTFAAFLKGVQPNVRVHSGRYGALMFHLPKEAQAWRIIHAIEENKQRLFVEDYSMSQLSLEEVFMRTVLNNVPAHRTKVQGLRIVMLVVGTRGDVQPLLALALGLAAEGNTVRLATHEKFRDFVEDEARRCLGRTKEFATGRRGGSRGGGSGSGSVSIDETGGGLHFFPLAGKPEELMTFMVENPDLLTIDAEKIRTHQEIMYSIFTSCWTACTTPSGFVPDVLIANPPVQCHPHIAEKLQVPLQVYFTMPYSTTAMYPHPFAATNKFGNRQTYAMVEKFIWLGLGAKINELRTNVLKLKEMKTGAGLAEKISTPYVYCISEYLMQRPSDWGPHIVMTGNWFLPRDTSYEPPAEVEAFVQAGAAPVYIGFGSIVLQDAASFFRVLTKGMRLVLEQDPAARFIVHTDHALRLTSGPLAGYGHRVLVCSGAIDHMWLLPHCRLTVHHGGAGTVTTSLSAGCPMVCAHGLLPFPFQTAARRKPPTKKYPPRRSSSPSSATSSSGGS